MLTACHLSLYFGTVEFPTVKSVTEKNREEQGLANKMLPDDVLLEIFQYIDSVKDLANCELVCSGWRKTIAQGYPWKKLYLKKVRI